MRKATRQEEIKILQKILLDNSGSSNYSTLSRALHKEERLHKVTCSRIAAWQQPTEFFPAYWQWQEFLVTLQLGWLRYFYACSHKDSIFCKLYFYEKKVTKNCECCLHWRGIATGFLLAIILFSLFTLGKFLL